MHFIVQAATFIALGKFDNNISCNELHFVFFSFFFLIKLITCQDVVDDVSSIPLRIHIRGYSSSIIIFTINPSMANSLKKIEYVRRLCIFIFEIHY